MRNLPLLSTTNPAYLGRGCSEGKAKNNVVSSPADKWARNQENAYAARKNEVKGLLTLLGKVLKNYINPCTVVTSPIK